MAGGAERLAGAGITIDPITFAVATQNSASFQPGTTFAWVQDSLGQSNPFREVRLERRTLAQFEVDGISTTIPFHRRLLERREFVRAELHTRWIDEQAHGHA